PPVHTHDSVYNAVCAAYAARYLSLHSLEQKCTICPFTVRRMLKAVETKVPHTGSFFSSPPAMTGGACGGSSRRGALRTAPKMLLRKDRRKRKTRRGRTISIMR